MKTIIAGGREFSDYEKLSEVMSAFDVSVVVSGKARGADSLGEKWARENGKPVEEYPANWDLYGKRAGYIRNQQMADNAEALVAFWDGKSRGTQHMINIAKEKGLTVHVERY